MFVNDSKEKDLQKHMELTMKRVQYKSFDEWAQNFALNLENIWDESSAAELDLSLDVRSSHHEKKRSAIVIGRGPSIERKKHLKLLAESNYKGSIVCCDGKLKDALKAGVTPDRFPSYYVATIDPYFGIKEHYNDIIIDDFGPKIKGLFTTIVNPSTVERARKAGIKIHWFHSLFDYNEGKKSFNQISALMVRAKNHLKGLPAIQTGGNVGTSAWFIAWKILKCSTISLIGINHGWEEDDSWEKIISHGRTMDKKIHGKISLNFDKKNPNFKKLFKKIYNPEFDCYGIADPIFQFYSEALKEFIARSPDSVTTINATEGGIIFGDKIMCMTFKKFLEQYKI